MQLLPGGTPSSPRKQWLQKDSERSGLRHLLDVDKLIRRPDLAGGDDILDLGHDQRNDCEWFTDAGGFGDHTDLHHLRLDLSEAGYEGGPPRFCGHEDAGGP